jgi:hypothetical protein
LLAAKWGSAGPHSRMRVGFGLAVSNFSAGSALSHSCSRVLSLALQATPRFASSTHVILCVRNVRLAYLAALCSIRTCVPCVHVCVFVCVSYHVFVLCSPQDYGYIVVNRGNSSLVKVRRAVVAGQGVGVGRGGCKQELPRAWSPGR